MVEFVFDSFACFKRYSSRQIPWVSSLKNQLYTFPIGLEKESSVSWAWHLEIGTLWQRGGKRKETIRRTCNYITGIWISPPIPRGSPSTELSDFCQWAQSWNQHECKQTWKNTWKHMPRVMTSLLMSSLPISILHRLFQCRYSNSREVVANSPSFSLPATRLPRRACSQPFLVTVNCLTPMIGLVILFTGCYFYFK